jgi:hypothetical protein
MTVVWSGTLDKTRQLEDRAGVPEKRQSTFSLIETTSTRSLALVMIEAAPQRAPEYRKPRTVYARRRSR